MTRVFLRTFLILLFLPVALPLLGQQQYEAILIPSVANRPVAGAFGSLWATEVTVANWGTETLQFIPAPYISVPISALPWTQVEAGRAFSVTSIPDSPHGVVLLAWPDHAARLGLSARVRDLSRALDTWGTSLPIVRESSVGTTPISLLNLPNDDRFRVSLRLYDFAWRDLPLEFERNTFLIEVYAMDGVIPLRTYTVPSTVLRDLYGGRQWDMYFAYVADVRVNAANAERLRLVIRTEHPTKFWGFASVTNNETQHVTVVEPQRLTAPRSIVPTIEVHKEQRTGVREKREEVISTNERWNAVWAEIVSGRSPRPPAPSIDFSTHVLIFVARGETGDSCRQVAIDYVEAERENFAVFVNDVRRPKSCACPPVTVQPVHVVAVPRIAQAGTFHYASVTVGPACN